MLGSNHSSQRETSVSPRRVALDTTASGSTTGFGFDRGKGLNNQQIHQIYGPYLFLIGHKENNVKCPSGNILLKVSRLD